MKKKKLLNIPYRWYFQMHSEGIVNGCNEWFLPDKASAKEIKKFLKQVKKNEIKE